MNSKLEFLNLEQLVKLVGDLGKADKAKATRAGLSAAAREINKVAKSNLNATKKGFSKTGYASFRKAFNYRFTKGADKKSLAMLVGIKHREGYKLRFINYGTDERITKGTKKYPAGASRGSLKATHFFNNAVTSTQERAGSIISEALIKSLTKIVSNYA